MTLTPLVCLSLSMLLAVMLAVAGQPFDQMGAPLQLVYATTSIVISLLTYVGTTSFLRQARVAERTWKQRCPTCNYDLRASKERCPECGTAIAADSAAGREAKKI